MDVEIPPVPARYEPYRQELRQFLADVTPRTGWKRRTGLRAPESASDLGLLRSWVRAIYDRGYVLQRFSMA